ncbi:MAG: hypothetical protein E7554_08875 [Ruminococcaceae bacterium]|nr:hypothetical protein [Oscillospiraceae bacterium]
MNKITLAAQGRKTVFCLERSPRGAVRVAAAVAADLRRITGCRPCDIRVAGESSPLTGVSANADTVIVAGIVGEGTWIDEAAHRGLIVCSAIAGKRECYRITTAVLGDGRTAVLVAGSDLLGLEYGLYKISELCGVSPWHYWADVAPKLRDTVELDASALDITSKEPTIRLRGFFLNDEWPSLGGWTHDTFGGFNELFYEKVFDLLLRLKGNFLWPAMWSAVFSEDGLAYPTASADLADEYGITMGTSHHEPLFRAGEEFSHTMTASNDCGYGADWNYHANTRGIYEFWDYSVKRNKEHKSLITMGMRGERDSKLLGENATLKDNIDLIKKTIIDQKKILADNGLADAPKVLALYKEVEDYYHGDDTTEGLSRWDGLDDMMLLLSDDNYGNTRTLPTKENRDRAAGWGLYYHFDYHGGPISYEWVNSSPITKAWEQLTAAYAFGIRDLWVVNVGDLRPVELPLSYFLDLAYDFDKWSRPNRTAEWLEKWTRQQFGAFADEATLADISTVLNGYTRMNGDSHPEAVQEDTFSFACEEYACELERAERLDKLSADIAGRLPEECADSYFGLVGFPTAASANLRRMMILAGLQRIFCKAGSSYANELSAQVNACIASDKELSRQYNEDMAGGKWNKMMSSKHVAFFNWNGDGSDYPRTEKLNLPAAGEVFALLPGDASPLWDGESALPVLSDLENNTAFFFVTSTAENAPSFSVDADKAWISLTAEKIGCATWKYTVAADWSSTDIPDGDTAGRITLSTEGRTVELTVTARRTPVTAADSKCFIESIGIISMPAQDYAERFDGDDTEWCFIDNYGKGDACSMKLLPADTFCTDPVTAPALEYRFTINHPGEYTVTAVIAPTNDPVKFEGQKFAFALDGGQPEVINSLPDIYAAGDPDDEQWSRQVLDNCRRVSMKISLTGGDHSLRFIHLDAGIVLQKIEIAQQPSESFYGYRATYRS